VSTPHIDTTAYNITIIKGMPLVETFVIRDASGRRVSLYGYMATIHFRATAESGTILAVLATGNSHLVKTDLGTIEIRLSGPETVGISWTSAVYDLMIVSPNLVRWRPFAGTVSAISGATRVDIGVALPLG